jgi:hypothetical protein
MATEIGASGWFEFNIPQRDINGFVYYFHDLREQVRALIGPPAIR